MNATSIEGVWTSSHNVKYIYTTMDNDSIKKVLQAVNELADVFVEANEDGKISIKDITLVPQAFGLIKTLAENWAEAKKELANVDEETAKLIAGNLIHTFFKVQ